MDATDKKWINALKPYLGGGIVPYFRLSDGTVDAEKTMEAFCKAHDVVKIGPNGEDIPWPTS